MNAFWRLVCRALGHRWAHVGERRRVPGGFAITIQMCTRCDARRDRLTVRRTS